MSPIDFGPVGIALNVSQDAAYLAEATELERLEHSALWLPGGELDSLGRLSDLDDDQPGPTEVARQLAHRLTPGARGA